MAEAEDLKSSQCGFDPHSGHQHYANSKKPIGLWQNQPNRLKAFTSW